ncbi:alpha/beta-type small acid-soluble spore protein [Pseudalkalibacillus decolorationis]|uniref:alpha/beta-type small acid-soluble spore protein n=1 Tax=Pseudalkalibacillus decolorationis TaxID=163879 RepID=UPI0021497CA4|nr:alpha/beta-type small acid-soluble spore protein [Pseudalkalibacillus decolorationis]
MKQHPFLVPGCDQVVQQFREEFAHEFGIYRPAAESESITKKLVDKEKKDDC